MFRLLIVGLQLAAFLSSCEALRCIRCEGDLDICAASQTVENCNQYGPNQVCNNFYYYSNGQFIVQKGCYQKSTCEAQLKMQENFCGDHAGSNRPCRCCCRTNRCNRLEKGCIVPTKCGKPREGRTGRYDCPVNTKLGSVCEFACPADNDMIGAHKITCIKSGGTGKLVWSPLGQTCKKIRCEKIFAPENGDMNCVNTGSYGNQLGDNFLDTECTFKCNEGYKLVGANKTVCKRDETWSNEVPTCVIDPCEPIPTAPNRHDTCTDGFMLGSVCTFECKKGYYLVGEEATECVYENGGTTWDREYATCIRVRCFPPQHDPIEGSVSCTDKNFESSVCTFACDPGFQIDGTAVSTCFDDMDNDFEGEWSHPPPACIIIRVRCFPSQNDPIDGLVSCTDENFENSVCTFACNLGFQIDGTAVSTCFDDMDNDFEGEWSHPPPACIRRVRCFPSQNDPIDGLVSCTDENFENSVCTFACDPGFQIDGAAVSTCIDDMDNDFEGEWSHPPPACNFVMP